MTMKISFPFQEKRKFQEDLIKDATEAVSKQEHILIHAPTGIGKTISSLYSTINEAIEKNLKIFFLTARTTQHKIVLESIQKINQKSGSSIKYVDFVAKKEMCHFTKKKEFETYEFSQFCNNLKKSKDCNYYNNTYKAKELKPEAKRCVEKLYHNPEVTFEDVVATAHEFEVCPYEIALALAQYAQVIICDYNYVFNPGIRSKFFAQTDTLMDRAIIIVDEAHNLPSRILQSLSKTISTGNIKYIAQEIRTLHYAEGANLLEEIAAAIEKISQHIPIGQKLKIQKTSLQTCLDQVRPYENLMEELMELDKALLTDKKNERLINVAKIIEFLSLWEEELPSHLRVLTKEEAKGDTRTKISIKSLDPQEITKPVIDLCYSVLLMSATLTPPKMYADLLGFSTSPRNFSIQEYPSPFNKENRRIFLIPDHTTTYKQRTVEEFKRIAETCHNITKEIPGNSIIFFPSYHLMNQINNHFIPLSQKEVIEEQQTSSKKIKEDIISYFKKCQIVGSTLTAVVGGSFSEGIDLPGDLIKCVIVVGIPFAIPDLETKEQIAYYDELFSKGMEYGYIIPAMNKVIQSAGRCIRSEKDKGIIAFIDSRYQKEIYKKCFPDQDELRMTPDYLKEIRYFWEQME